MEDNSVFIVPFGPASIAESSAPDSIASGTAAVEGWPFAEICIESEAPSDLISLSLIHRAASCAEGIPGEPRQMLPGYDSGVMALVIGIFCIISFFTRNHSTFIKTFLKDLLTVREHSNIFDDHTVNESLVTGGLLVTLFLAEGILIAGAWRLISDTYPGIFISTAICTLLAAGIYGLQLIAYSITGYVFSTPSGQSQWLRGFNASQTLLALALLLPALALLFNPGLTVVMLWISGSFYVIGRMIFIFKGFRIFYTNIFSLIYFISYLCTLEIAPIVFLYRNSNYIE